MTDVQQQPAPVMSQADIFPHHSHVTRDMRNQQVGHRSGVIWLTGLSGAGKSTIATQVELELFREGFLVSVLDGDTMRSGLNCDLDFTRQARMENLRRAGEVASLFAMMGYIVLATFISPHHEGRRFVRNIVRKNFHLVHVRASLEDCIQRDPKGLYQKALSGDIANFTGISQAYEEPQDAELKIDTTSHTLPLCTAQLKNFIKDNFLLT